MSWIELNDWPCQRVSIALDLLGGVGLDSIALSLFADVVERLAKDGIQPYRCAVEITDAPPI